MHFFFTTIRKKIGNVEGKKKDVAEVTIRQKKIYIQKMGTVRLLILILKISLLSKM